MSEICEQTVLVVEDDLDIRESIAETLDDEGFHVAAAANGREALRKLEGAGGAPCVILLDLMMPDMDGWQFRKEQARNPTLATIPVVVVSADGNVGETAQSLGAAGHLRKPIQIHELVEMVLRFCKPLRAA